MATTTINRKEFGLNFGKEVAPGVELVGYDVKIDLLVEAIQDIGQSYIP